MMIINYFQIIIGEKNNMEKEISVTPKRKYTKKDKQQGYDKLGTISHVDYLKAHFPKQDGELKSRYINLWGNNYRINFYKEADIRSYFVQIREDSKGLSYKILD